MLQQPRVDSILLNIYNRDPRQLPIPRVNKVRNMEMALVIESENGLSSFYTVPKNSGPFENKD